MNYKKNEAPLNHEIEITLLGPGYGESIILHVGDNQWIVIDSCIDLVTKSCAPLKYFELIGVDPKNVVMIIATHWHDDHVKQLSKLFEVCSNAKFCCSSALTSEEFFAYIASFEVECNIKFSSGVSEFFNVLKILRNRGSSPPPIQAVCNRKLYSKPSVGAKSSVSCEIWALSPSDGEKDRFIKRLKNLIPIDGEVRYRASVEPNDVSIVIQVLIGNEKILLGADLEETSDNYTGWSVIVDSNERPLVKSSIFKIPHHGSSNAHSNRVWSELLENNPYALLTPFSKGRGLPSKSDVERINSLTSKAYSTAKLSYGSPKRRDALVEKEIKRRVGKLRLIPNNTGMIRIRKKMNISNADWDVQLFEGACHLSDLQ